LQDDVLSWFHQLPIRRGNDVVAWFTGVGQGSGEFRILCLLPKTGRKILPEARAQFKFL
jgi:hypothetical protein